MLVMSRHVGEKIIIGDLDSMHIEICVTKVRGRKVFIGVEAPKEVHVDRLEVAEARLKAKETT